MKTLFIEKNPQLATPHHKINILLDKINIQINEGFGAGILDSGCSTTALRSSEEINDFKTSKTSYFILGDGKRYKTTGYERMVIYQG